MLLGHYSAPPPPARVGDFVAGLVAMAIFVALVFLFTVAYDLEARNEQQRIRPQIEQLRELTTER